MKNNIKKILKKSYIVLYIFVITALGFFTYALVKSDSVSELISKYLQSYAVVIIIITILFTVLSLTHLLAIINKKKIIIALLSILLFTSSSGIVLASNYILDFQQELNNFEVESEEEVKVYFVALQESNIDSLDNKSIGMLSNKESKDGYLAPMEYVNSSSTISAHDYYLNWSDLLTGLVTNQEEVIVLPSTYDSILAENQTYQENKDNIVIVEEYTTKIKNTSSSKKLAKEEPFNILLIGVDSPITGEAGEVFLFDVIVLATVDPVHGNVLLTSIPRDSLFYSPCIGGVDKINHNGAYGVDCLVQTVESDLDTSVDYYMMIDFEGIITLVDALGGVTINNPYGDFVSQDENRVSGQVKVPGGTNLLNGQQTLAFARNRKSSSTGAQIDAVVRSSNHSVVVKAILNRIKEVGLSDINKYMNIISEYTTTNFPVGDLTTITDILSSLSSNDVNIKSITIKGRGVQFLSPAMGRGLYGTDPYLDYIEYTKNYIKLLLGQEITSFDSSFYLNAFVPDAVETLGIYTPGQVATYNPDDDDEDDKPDTGPTPEPVDPDPEPEPVDPDPEPEPVDPDPEPEPVDPDPEPEPVDPDPEPEPVDPDPEPEPVDPDPQPTE